MRNKDNIINSLTCMCVKEVLRPCRDSASAVTGSLVIGGRGFIDHQTLQLIKGMTNSETNGQNAVRLWRICACPICPVCLPGIADMAIYNLYVQSCANVRLPLINIRQRTGRMWTWTRLSNPL